MEIDERFWKIFRLIGSDNKNESAKALELTKQILVAQNLTWSWLCDEVIKGHLRLKAKAKFPQAEDTLVDEALKKVFGF